MNNNNQHIPSGYKLSPLGPIPEDWEVKKLGDLCENKGDYGLNAPATDYSVNLPTYLRITDIDDNGNFIHSAKKSVDNLSAKEYYLKDGDIVFARTGATVGKTYLYDVRDGQLVYAGFLIKFSPNPNKLIPYYLKAHTETKDYMNWVAITSQRSGQPGINAAEYCSLKLAIPPIKEQERICNVLQLWDTAIARQTALIEKLTLRKRGLMQQLLTGKKRLKGFGGEWKEVRLGEIGTAYGGLVNKNKEDFENGNALFITYMNVFSNGKIDINNLGQVRILPSEKQEQVQYGDIFFTVSSETPEEVGMASVLLNEVQNTYLNSFCFGYRLNDFKSIIPVYASYLFRGDDFRKKMYKIAQGSTRFNISKTEVLNMRITIPSIEEQNTIASVLVNADKEIEIQKQKLARLQEEKKGLMQVLLTGKKRIEI